MKELMRLVHWKRMSPLLGALIVSLVFFCYFVFFYASASNQLYRVESKLNQAKQRTLSAIDSKERLDHYQLDIANLVGKGYMSEPNRLQWLQALQSVVDDYQIPQVKFTLSPTSDPGSQNVGFSDAPQSEFLLETPMLIEMELMHEGDFYFFMTEYRKKAFGIFRVESCELNRIDQRTTETANLLRSECQLTWLNYPDPRKQWQDES